MKGDEMIYTFNLRRAYEKPRTKRARVAVKLLRELAMRHAKADAAVVSNRVNAFIWQHGLKKPPRRVRVKLKKVGNVVYILDVNEELKAPAPAKEEKAEKAEKEGEKAKPKAKAKKEAKEKKEEQGEKAKKKTKTKEEEKAEKKAEKATGGSTEGAEKGAESKGQEGEGQ